MIRPARSASEDGAPVSADDRVAVNSNRTTPLQLAGNIPPFATSRLAQLAAFRSATQVLISACVLTALAVQSPLQQAVTPAETQSAT